MSWTKHRYKAMPQPGPNDWLNGPGKTNGDRKGQKLCEWPGQNVASALKQSKKIVLVPRAVFMTQGGMVCWYRQTLDGSFSAVSKPIFATK